MIFEKQIAGEGASGHESNGVCDAGRGACWRVSISHAVGAEIACCAGSCGRAGIYIYDYIYIYKYSFLYVESVLRAIGAQVACW